MYCPKCGKIIDDNSSFCPSCGGDTVHGEVVAVKAESKSVFSSIGVVFASISLACLLISFLLGYFVKDSSAIAFNIFSTTFLIASFPFFVIALVKNVYSKKPILNSLLSLVFIIVAFIFGLFTSGSLTTVIISTSGDPHTFYLSVFSMTTALIIASIVFGAISIKQK